MSGSDVLAAIAVLRTEMQAATDLLRGALTGSRADVMGKLERIEDRLTLIREDATANMGAAGTALDRTDCTRKAVISLPEMVTTMHRPMMHMRTDTEEMRKAAAPDGPRYCRSGTTARRARLSVHAAAQRTQPGGPLPC